MSIKHVFFDLDHTLWDFETNSKKSFQYIFEQNNITIDIDVFLEKYIPINYHYWKLYREEKVTKAKLRYGRLKESFDKLDYTVSDDLINKLADDYLINLANYNQLFKGAIELLDYLKPKYKLHIITNGFVETQLAKMKNANILHYFDKIITSEGVGVKKPNPKIFFYALKETNAKTYESIMIGDSLEADIYGAKNVGIKSIYFNPDSEINAKEKYLTVTNLLQIKQHL
jgi:putative hydrolase of the HAD superfamily